ncbi:MAG: hypothetical protein D6736_05740 [Nitrospinota bacterium]|nr:MAG: hypothetical protein D6736_05740 [Nitrospinota bacterium]
MKGWHKIAILILWAGMPLWVFAHTDPPLMKLTMQPGMPRVKEEATLRIHLQGSNAGIPVLGAKIKIVLSNDQGKQLIYTAKATEQAGEYLGTISFPQPGMWKMRVEVEHRNELDFRQYMVHVMAPTPGKTPAPGMGTMPASARVMTDETILKMDKNAAHQPLPPQVVLGGYLLLILALLATVRVIKQRQRPA